VTPALQFDFRSRGVGSIELSEPERWKTGHQRAPKLRLYDEIFKEKWGHLQGKLTVAQVLTRLMDDGGACGALALLLRVLLMVIDRTQRAFAAFANIPYQDPLARQELLRLLDDADETSVANCWTTRFGARPLRRGPGNESAKLRHTRRLDERALERGRLGR
jgi:hypothetical protein